MLAVSLVRTFIAVDVESSEILGKLARVRDYIASSQADLKPVSVENMHITLRFIGEVPLAKVQEICEALQRSVKFRPFTMRIEGIGAFPNVHRPRVIWAGVTTGALELTKLAREVDEALRKAGIPPSEERFTPHITLHRVKSLRNISSLLKHIDSVINEFFGEVLVDKVKVKRSILTSSGPIYNDLCVVKAVER